MGPVKTWLNARALPISDLPISAASLAQLINVVQEGKLSHHQAVQQVWPAWLEQPNRSLQDLLKDLGLEGGTVEDDLPALVQEVLASMPAKVQEYRDGKKGLLALFMGEIMKRTGGRAQPARASALLQEALN
jgi:aspartyl-tRNA(Asn)/glutamyl-tRNA(Gln) amidotransferase subunit B